MHGGDLLYGGWFGVFSPRKDLLPKATHTLQKAKAEPVPKPWQRWEGDGGSWDAGHELAASGSTISLDQFTHIELGSGSVGQAGGKLGKSNVFQPLSSGFHQNRPSLKLHRPLESF